MQKILLPQNISRIVVMRALFLGDLLLTVPTLRALRRRFPHAEITLIGLPWASTFVGHFGHYIDRLVCCPAWPGLAELPDDPEVAATFIVEQQAYGYDLAIQMHGDGCVSNGLVANLGARFSMGYALPNDDRLDWCMPYFSERHELLRWLDLVQPLGAPVDDTKIELPVPYSSQRHADELLAEALDAGRPIIGLHVGAKDPARRWPVNQFADLGDMLADLYGARIVLTGAAHEASLTSAVRRRMRAPAIDLAGRTDLGTFAAVLAQFNLLVTNDTGASHLATATGTQSVVLFGPTRPWQFAPLNKARHRTLDALDFAPPQADPITALQRMPIEPVLATCAVALGTRLHERMCA